MSTEHEADGQTGGIRDCVQEAESIAPSWHFLWRFVSIWGGTFLMAFVICGGALGLALFSAHVSKQEPAIASADQDGSGIIAWSEITDVWMPLSCVEMARRLSWPGSNQDRDEFKFMLEHRGQEGPWYAVVVRAHQVNGHWEDMLFVRRPYRDAGHFAELMEILDAAAEGCTHFAAADSPPPSVHLLPEEMMLREPGKVMAELLGYPRQARDRERADIFGTPR